jgi:type II secretory pathway component GspD/PulD (secretin)
LKIEEGKPKLDKIFIKNLRVLQFVLAALLFVFPLLVCAQENTNADTSGAIAQPYVPASSGSDNTLITDADPGKISLDLKGIDIVELLKILAVKMSVNIAPTKEVTGRVNIFLNNVTLDDALEILLINNALAAIKEGNIIKVMTLERYNQLYGKRYDEIRKTRTYKLKNASPKDVFNTLSQLKSDVGKIIIDETSGTLILIDVPDSLNMMEKTLMSLEKPKETRLFELKYAKAEDIKGQLATVLTPGISQIETDTRTNKILVTDLPDKLKKIEEMIDEFDEPTRQVLIEAQIVQITLNNTTALGVNWERLFTYNKMKNINFKGQFPLTNVPSAGQFSVGTLAENDFSLVLTMLNQVTKANVLSRPRIAVLNNQEASILIGAKEVYFSQTQSQSSVTTTTAEAVNFVDVGIKINVTPTITADGFVIMKIRPEVSSVRETKTSPLGSSVPVVETSQAETTVKVKDNVMVMIAGLMKDEVGDVRIQYPWVHKIPLIGWMFGNTNARKNKSELAIFLTPRIITGDIEKVPDAELETVKARGTLTKKPMMGIE